MDHPDHRHPRREPVHWLQMSDVEVGTYHRCKKTEVPISRVQMGMNVRGNLAQGGLTCTLQS